MVSEEYATDTYLKLSGEYDKEDWRNCIDPAPFYDEDFEDPSHPFAEDVMMGGGK